MQQNNNVSELIDKSVPKTIAGMAIITAALVLLVSSIIKGFEAKGLFTALSFGIIVSVLNRLLNTTFNMFKWDR